MVSTAFLFAHQHPALELGGLITRCVVLVAPLLPTTPPGDDGSNVEDKSGIIWDVITKGQLHSSNITVLPNEGLTHVQIRQCKTSFSLGIVPKVFLFFF